jgi:hypothetical protein
VFRSPRIASVRRRQNVITECVFRQEIDRQIKHTVFHKNFSQVTTTAKGVNSDACYSGGNGYACKTGALIKCLLPNTRYAIWNINAYQVFATVKRVIPNDSHAFRNIDTCQAFAECYMDEDTGTGKFQL